MSARADDLTAGIERYKAVTAAVKAIGEQVKAARREREAAEEAAAPQSPPAPAA